MITIYKRLIIILIIDHHFSHLLIGYPMWDEYKEAKANYLLSGLVLIYLGVIKIIIASVAAYFETHSAIMDPVSIALLGALLIVLGFWMRSDDAL